MAATPETIRPDVPPIVEHQEEFIVPENLQSSMQPVQKTFKSQIQDDKGKPIIQTPPNQIITVKLPYNQTTLIAQAKGSVSSSLTWLSAFWIRIIKKAIYFKWSIQFP